MLVIDCQRDRTPVSSNLQGDMASPSPVREELSDQSPRSCAPSPRTTTPHWATHSLLSPAATPILLSTGLADRKASNPYRQHRRASGAQQRVYNPRPSPSEIQDPEGYEPQFPSERAQVLKNWVLMTSQMSVAPRRAISVVTPSLRDS